MLQTLTVLLYGKPIGVLKQEPDGYCAFQYTDAFCASGLQPSPLMMPAVPGRIYRFTQLDRNTFSGLPGMQSDSLPDRFGRALLDQWLEATGRRGDANALEKLSFQGTRCMGALEYQPARDTYLEEQSVIELDKLVDTAAKALASKEAFKTYIEDKEQAVLDIIKIGTSAGGQRAKAVIGINEKTGEIRSGQVMLPEDFGYWIIKLDGFDSNGKPMAPANFGRREYAFHKCALDSDIKMTQCKLLEENGRAHFMTRRFDRTNGQKVHMQTLCAIAHYNYNMPGAYSYEQAFAVMRRLGMNQSAAEEMFRRTVFNVLVKNMDDHTKNISFLMDRQGRWMLSPAYDIGYNFNPYGMWANSHQMTIRGKRDGITRNDLIELAKSQGLDNPDDLIGKVSEGISNFRKYAADAKIPQDETEFIARQIDENLIGTKNHITQKTVDNPQKTKKKKDLHK